MSQTERFFGIIELLFANPEGLQLIEISERINTPKSAAHRLLNSLKDHGYAYQKEDGSYCLTLMLPALGQGFLHETGFKPLVMPELISLAEDTGESVRLTAVAGDELIWICHAVGRSHGLRYDGLTGSRVPPHVTANGKIWLSSMSDEDAAAIVSKWGFKDDSLGPNAISSIRDLLEYLQTARKNGFAIAEQEAELGVSAIAMGIHSPDDPKMVLGTISVAGPTVRLPRAKLKKLTGRLKSAANSVSRIWGVWLRANGHNHMIELIQATNNQ